MLIRYKRTGGKAKPLKAPKKKVTEEDEEDKVCSPPLRSAERQIN